MRADAGGFVIIAGIAPGLGGALALRFATEGYRIAGIARGSAFGDEMARAIGPQFRHHVCDVTESASLRDTLSMIASEAPVAGFIWNPMNLVIKPFAELTEQEFEAAWRVICLGAFNAAQAILPHVLKGGTLIFTGATASLRSGTGFAGFAAAKFALRALAQSLAREYGPKGVHVVHTVLDGLIDSPQTFARFPKALPETCLSPEAVADAYVNLFRQPPCAWTHELDLRPSTESF